MSCSSRKILPLGRISILLVCWLLFSAHSKLIGKSKTIFDFGCSVFEWTFLCDVKVQLFFLPVLAISVSGNRMHCCCREWRPQINILGIFPCTLGRAQFTYFIYLPKSATFLPLATHKVSEYFFLSYGFSFAYINLLGYFFRLSHTTHAVAFRSITIRRKYFFLHFFVVSLFFSYCTEISIFIFSFLLCLSTKKICSNSLRLDAWACMLFIRTSYRFPFFYSLRKRTHRIISSWIYLIFFLRWKHFYHKPLHCRCW